MISAFKPSKLLKVNYLMSSPPYFSSSMKMNFTQMRTQRHLRHSKINYFNDLFLRLFPWIQFFLSMLTLATNKQDRFANQWHTNGRSSPHFVASLQTIFEFSIWIWSFFKSSMNIFPQRKCFSSLPLFFPDEIVEWVAVVGRGRLLLLPMNLFGKY